MGQPIIQAEAKVPAVRAGENFEGPRVSAGDERIESSGCGVTKEMNGSVEREQSEAAVFGYDAQLAADSDGLREDDFSAAGKLTNRGARSRTDAGVEVAVCGLSRRDAGENNRNQEEFGLASHRLLGLRKG